MDFAAERIGFLGLRAVSEPIATRLSGGSHKLVVFDIRKEAVVSVSLTEILVKLETLVARGH
jgi:3-hydroxyisobutyrate dehydrogenase-like beta-hydroxyacid dehydrogenase